jgi:hypothetical protein
VVTTASAEELVVAALVVPALVVAEVVLAALVAVAVLPAVYRVGPGMIYVLSVFQMST